MTNYDAIDFSDLLAMSEEEVITHSFVKDIPLPSGKILALVTLDNGLDYKRPNTLGPRSLMELDHTLVSLSDRAGRGEIHGVGLTGKEFILAAGADLSRVGEVPSKEMAVKLAQLGHRSLGRLSELGVPSFVFINGLALGGGLEVALNADFRTIDSSVSAVALPEVFLGLIPGWGGAYLLPNLIGIENALKVIIENPLKNNRMLNASAAFDLGISDAIFGSARFLEESILWADTVINGHKPHRPNQPGKIERLAKWNIAVNIATKSVEDKLGKVAKSPFVALELLEQARKVDKVAAFEREDEAIASLIVGDQFQASMYAFDLVQKRAKRPAGAPDASLSRPVGKVGVIGAGLMARQFALLFVRKLKVPVVLTDINQDRLNEALTYIHAEIQSMHDKERISSDENKRLQALVSGTTNPAAFADADWVIEAVFEELSVKQDVFASIEEHIAPDAILATNTSSLSVAEIGAKLKHPERLVGFHFFNPVAVMPLVEVVKAPHTNDQTLATAMDTAKKLGKTAVITSDSPGFVVNRLLARLLGEAMHAVDTGTPFKIVDESVGSFGMPMAPFELLDLVGLKVGAHVLDTHHAAFPDRFFRSDNLHKLAEHGSIIVRGRTGKITGYDRGAEAIVKGGGAPMTSEQIRLRIEDGLADEIHRMLEENVVSAAEDIDLCMIMGAGWPFQMGGATPFLDRIGASQRVFGRTFHNPMILGTKN
jgi:3-hydroxyacyl-CoA dehydrogenase/enoyl-CoA hydratase/carnithine racemase